jgi:hypothetical protein
VSDLWPRLPEVVASELYQKLLAGAEPSPAVSHPEQIFAPVGGTVSTRVVQELKDRVTALAQDFGFPDAVGNDVRVSFDRACAPLLKELIDMSWAEAGNRSVWSFVSLVVLPHVTMWRFGVTNAERWLATDLTRHTWARLWWQAVVFAEDAPLLNALSESDLNQLLERRSIGGDPRLVRAVGWVIVDESNSDVPRRYLIRDLTLRLNRWLAFVDVRALSGDQVRLMCGSLAAETLQRYRESA